MDMGRPNVRLAAVAVRVRLLPPDTMTPTPVAHFKQTVWKFARTMMLANLAGGTAG